MSDAAIVTVTVTVGDVLLVQTTGRRDEAAELVAEELVDVLAAHDDVVIAVRRA